jgi:hypothetical protein
MNTQEKNNIPLLQEVLEQYRDGTLDMTQRARKCYLSERERMSNNVSWIHNDELEKQMILRKMSKDHAKDLLKARKLL